MAKKALPYRFPEDCARFTRQWCPWCERHDDLGYVDVVNPDAGRYADRYGWPLQVVKCGGCSLLYSRECWTHDGAKRFYAQHYRPLVNAYHGKPEGYDWREESAAHYAEVEQIIGYPMTHPHVLDVGGMGRGVGPEADGQLWETATPSKHHVVVCAQTFDHLIDPALAWRKFTNATWDWQGTLYIDVVDPHAVLQRGQTPWKSDHTLFITPKVLLAMADPKVWRLRQSGYLKDGIHFFGVWERVRA